MLFVARVGHRNLVQQLLPIRGEGSKIIVISSLGVRAVAGTPDCPVVASFTVCQPCRAPGGLPANWKLSGVHGGISHLKSACGSHSHLASIRVPVDHAETCNPRRKLPRQKIAVSRLARARVPTQTSQIGCGGQV